MVIVFIGLFWSEVFYPGDLVLAVGDLDNVPHIVQGGEEALRVPQSEAGYDYWVTSFSLVCSLPERGGDRASK